MTEAPTIRVLVVDDDARVRNALSRLLSDVSGIQGLSVDGDQAMRLVKWGSAVCDVAVVDMPSTSSAASLLVPRLAAVIPVVVVSLSPMVRRAALAAGAGHFVEKGGDPDSLIAAIRAMAPAALTLGTRDRPASDRALTCSTRRL